MVSRNTKSSIHIGTRLVRQKATHKTSLPHRTITVNIYMNRVIWCIWVKSPTRNSRTGDGFKISFWCLVWRSLLATTRALARATASCKTRLFVRACIRRPRSQYRPRHNNCHTRRPRTRPEIQPNRNVYSCIWMRTFCNCIGSYLPFKNLTSSVTMRFLLTSYFNVNNLVCWISKSLCALHRRE